MTGTVDALGASPVGGVGGFPNFFQSIFNPTGLSTPQVGLQPPTGLSPQGTPGALPFGLQPLTGLPSLGTPGGGMPQDGGYSPSPDLQEEAGGPGGGAGGDQQQAQIQYLMAQIQMDLEQLQQDTMSGDQQAQQQDAQQLQQDLQQLQALMGGGQAAAPPPPPPASAGPSDSGGGGGGDTSGGGGGSSPTDTSGGGSGSGSPASSGSGSSAPSGSNSSTTYDGAAANAAPQSVKQNAQIVAQVARQKGVDPTTAVATMLAESGGDNKAVGDGGTSFGLFQLHQGGELGNLSQAQADDPTTNANTALSVFASTEKSTGLTGGALAAAAQRPANPSAYAATVNAKMGEARSLIGG